MMMAIPMKSLIFIQLWTEPDRQFSNFKSWITGPTKLQAPPKHMLFVWLKDMIQRTNFKGEMSRLWQTHRHTHGKVEESAIWKELTHMIIYDHERNTVGFFGNLVWCCTTEVNDDDYDYDDDHDYDDCYDDDYDYDDCGIGGSKEGAHSIMPQMKGRVGEGRRPREANYDDRLHDDDSCK